MKKWEYHIAKFSMEVTMDDILSRINALGLKGWELVWLVPQYAYFKREILNAS